MKANQFFFLSAVDSHIEADFQRFDNQMIVKFWNEADKEKTCVLEVCVIGSAKDFTVSYQMTLGSQVIQHATSDNFPACEVSGILAALANDALRIQS